MDFKSVEQPAPGLPKTTTTSPGLIKASIGFKMLNGLVVGICSNTIGSQVFEGDTHGVGLVVFWVFVHQASQVLDPVSGVELVRVWVQSDVCIWVVEWVDTWSNGGSSRQGEVVLHFLWERGQVGVVGYLSGQVGDLTLDIVVIETFVSLDILVNCVIV
ncbi:hypothetical protein WICPIJ_002279 [Wickerhamomyces pijperi]|uniref:Uncharacterized protein n=1 Tax=Wickerhamomyces pijperi TaxID=599730 RepID=A0A9P8TQC1_WICPI|nr:hypothetical protein WICPIJ_002279 [Wickerhamomyces pijperi]